MKVIVYQTTNKRRTYTFSDEQESLVCEKCFLQFESNKVSTPKCSKSRFFFVKTVKDNSFCFCLKEAKTRKKAKYLANLFFEMYSSIREAKSEAISELSKPADVAVHNTRNLNAEINSKLLSLVNEDLMTRAEDKVNYVENLIKKNPREFARAIISVLKSTTQILNEYNVYDFLDPYVQLARADFSTHKIHKLCVISYYLYEQEFKEKNIKFDIQKSFAKVFVNWSTARTAFSQILDNCLKYCKPSSKIQVSFVSEKGFLEIRMTMTSIFFSNAEKSSLTLPGKRGKFVPLDEIKGEGMGMYIINRMVQLNQGLFEFSSNENTQYKSGGRIYSENSFMIAFKSAP